jgi:hypothetical protein
MRKHGIKRGIGERECIDISRFKAHIGHLLFNGIHLGRVNIVGIDVNANRLGGRNEFGQPDRDGAGAASAVQQ